MWSSKFSVKEPTPLHQLRTGESTEPKLWWQDRSVSAHSPSLQTEGALCRQWYPKQDTSNSNTNDQVMEEQHRPVLINPRGSQCENIDGLWTPYFLVLLLSERKFPPRRIGVHTPSRRPTREPKPWNYHLHLESLLQQYCVSHPSSGWPWKQQLQS